MVKKVLGTIVAVLVVGSFSVRAEQCTSCYLYEVHSSSEQNNSDVAGLVGVVSGCNIPTDCSYGRIYIPISDKHLLAMALTASLNNKQVGITYEKNATAENISGASWVNCKMLHMWWN